MNIQRDNRDNRLDALKAISIIFVLIWHLRPISFLVNNNTHVMVIVIARIIRDLELQLSLTAVPLFFNLMALTIISFLYAKINYSIIKIISSVTVIFSLLYFEVVGMGNSSIPYHWLSNFILYIPIAFYLANKGRQVLKFRFYYLVTYILFSLHDIYLRIYGYNQSIYGRISIVFGALTIFCYIYTLKIPDNWYIQKLSQYSLGLFAIHKYWQSLLFLLVKHYEISLLPTIAVIPLNIIFTLVGAFVVLLTVLSIYLLKSTSLKQFIF